jgi:hypothetical protein
MINGAQVPLFCSTHFHRPHVEKEARASFFGFAAGAMLNGDRGSA